MASWNVAAIFKADLVSARFVYIYIYIYICVCVCVCVFLRI